MTESSNSEKQLIILGNGFDLQSGLKSRFRDFFQWKFDLSKQSVSEIEKISNSFRIELQNNNVTIWDVLFYTEGLSDNYLWVDVEKRIKEFLLDLPRFVVSYHPYLSHLCNGGFITRKTGDEIFVAMNNIIASRYAAINEKLGSLIDINEKADWLNKILFTELRLLEESYVDFLSEQVRNPSYSYTAYNNVKRIIDLEPRAITSRILSFNYTTPIDEALLDRLTIDQYRNIHGTLSERNIIIGIDGHEDTSDGGVSLLGFTKTFRQLNTDRWHDTTGIYISGNIKVIKIFGHSLGEADYSYFQAILDKVEIYGGTTVLVFIIRHGGNKEEAYVKVEKLLRKYGTSLDNKDHGRNLMHKLLLEDRLLFREL